jgi:crotonobetainyl-CoA:carnitine CoA-transferase CaiB-like acyl-CoA transferase
VYPDHLGFVMGPTLLVAALLNSRRTGKGVTIDLAQIEGTAAVLGTTYLETSVNGDDPQPKGNHYAAAAPQGCYRCQGEDCWCVISARDDDEWRAFCRVIGRSELVRDARFVNLQARLNNRVELDGIVQQWTEARPAEEVMVQCQSSGVPAGVVQTGADLLQDVQLRHRNYFSPFADSLIGPFEIPRSGFLFRGVNEEPLRLPNRLGADNDPILSELLGYDQATIEQWRQEEILT